MIKLFCKSSWWLKAAAFLIHVGTQQLPRQMPTYIEKKHYHVGKKVADICFVWHLDTLFQPNDILVGTSLFTIKHIHFQDHRQEINAL